MNSSEKALAVKNGEVLLPEGKLTLCDILILDGIISEIGSGIESANVIDAEGCLVVPGLIDLHTHGIERISTDSGSLIEYARLEALHGATAFFPTLFGSPQQSAKNIKRLLDETDNLRKTLQIHGFRLESPYLAKTGAGLENDLSGINHKVTGLLRDAAGEHIKIWDISPELEGSAELIRELTADGIVCSIAHTNATVEQAHNAVDAGARLITHLFDTFDVPKMGDPGVYPAGLVDYFLVEDRVMCEIIGDSTHVHPLLVEKAFRCKTPDRLVFVTDSNCGAGLPPGRYNLPGNWGNVEISGSNNGVRMVDRNMGLAGSALTPIDNFRNVIELFGKDIRTASMVCSKNPAELMGLNKGEIAAGRDADLLILDHSFYIEYTIAGGNVLYQKAEQS